MKLVHELRVDAGRSCLTLHGEIDLFVRDELHAVLQHAVGLSQSVTEVDLRDVTFLDCAGIGALMAAYHTAEGQGRAVCVSHAWGPVRRVLEMTGVLRQLTSAKDTVAA